MLPPYDGQEPGGDQGGGEKSKIGGYFMDAECPAPSICCVQRGNGCDAGWQIEAG